MTGPRDRGCALAAGLILAALFLPLNRAMPDLAPIYWPALHPTIETGVKAMTTAALELLKN